MRTGTEYREALRSDGRNVWVFGEGRVEDVTAHPATAAMVDEYARWYHAVGQLVIAIESRGRGERVR
jgi:aromatic ring hydroxylase